MSNSEKKIILTGDRPTGKLHLGHYVGSLKHRVALQDKYECNLIIADLHTLTTKPEKSSILEIREHTRDMVLDYLAAGIDPKKTTIYLQSEIPAAYEMNLFFEMFVSVNRLSGLPSLKEMARNAHISEDSIPFGLLGYPVLQSADILMFKANLVPVGKDNEAHVELTRDIARRFNMLYGDFFPMPEILAVDTPTLVGTDNKGKMSKSAGNSIFLSDDEKMIEKRVASMYTDPNRIHAHIKGTVVGNPTFIYHDLFNDQTDEVADLKRRYEEGTVGDVDVKKSLAAALNRFLAPFRERRAHFEKDKGLIEEILYEGTLKAREITDKNLKEMKSLMGLRGHFEKISRVARERKKMPKFQLETPFAPFGDQPKAIEALTKGLRDGLRSQVLLGVTGSGKTFTMANVVQEIQKPTLVIAHNKTLAAQLYQEFKSFFPHNAVEYFVSYYDYYQPEAYIARTDTYIEKDLAINDEIDRMRLSATRSLLEREDVLIVASVSCIYGLGSPEFFRKMHLELFVGKEIRRDDLLLHLVEMQYKRNDYDFARATFRVRGDLLEIFPAYEQTAIRVEMFDKEVEKISSFDPLTGKTLSRLEKIAIYPSSHHVTPVDVRENAMITIKQELEERANLYETEGRLLERERILQRTRYDLEVIQEIGFCKGIENYSRHFSQRLPGEPPSCLIDYFPKDFLLFVDESHQTLPQIHAMYHGDRSRKNSLVDYGFRLPSAFDNRPLTFHEAYERVNQVVYVSATPAAFEIEESGGHVVEQIIRPTGLLDPQIEVRPATGQVDDCLEEIRQHTEKGGRVLVTTLTKKLSEDLTKYLTDLNVKAKYLHSEIDTIERSAILAELREGGFDVLVGINLLREGLDLPEVSLVAILDADKEGFLRSETSLVQTCGRAARNSEGRVIMYADKETKAIKATLAITEKRRAIQEAYNKEHGMSPTTVIRPIKPLVLTPKDADSNYPIEALFKNERLNSGAVERKIKSLEREMKKKAKELQFEEAAKLRDQLNALKNFELTA